MHPHLADQKRMLAEIRHLDGQVKSSHCIRPDDMKAWLLPWDTNREPPPPPKYVCGKPCWNGPPASG